MTWLTHLGIEENVTLQYIKNIKNTITSKFKEKMWDEQELELKRKLRYYKEVNNPNLKDKKYLSLLISSNKKTNIAKTIPKTGPWIEIIYHLYGRVEDESQF